jgi:superfamily I DNA/RNA helicase
MFIKNKEDNLAWRIISSRLLTADDLATVIKKSEEDKSKMLNELLPLNLVKNVLETVKTVKSILGNNPVDPALLAATFKQFEIVPDEIASTYLRNEFYTLHPPGGNPALRNISIKVTTIQSSKGLSADVVFIVNFDDRFFLKDGKNITDQDICNFLVALTRTKKKAFLISTIPKTIPSLLKWIAKDKIEFIK